jgi:hypothetical protein
MRRVPISIVALSALGAVSLFGQARQVHIRFTNVALAAGLTHALEHSPTPRKHLVETMTGGVAAFDYDGDRRIDLYLANGAALPSLEKTSPSQWNRLYRNDGGLHFTDVTEAAGVRADGFSMGVASADYDNDGRADLFVAGVGRNLLFHNAVGTFEDVTARSGIASAAWSVAGAWLDYDKDGWLDLFVVNYLDWTPAFDKFCGDRGRGIRVYCHPRDLAGLANAIYRNRRDGTFEDVSTSSGVSALVGKGMSAAVLDADDDGWSDVYVTNDSVPSFLLRNTGKGRFEDVALVAGVSVPAHGRPISAMGVDAQDADNDGKPDLLVTALAGETFPLYRNDGEWQFRDATYSSGLGRLTARLSGWGIHLADFDNDGWKDVFAAASHVNDRIEAFEENRYQLSNAVFRNDKGRFTSASEDAGSDFQMAAPHRGSAVADFDNDGKLDVIVTSLGRGPELWHNESASEGHWLSVQLTGTRDNRDGIGARVRVTDQVVSVTTASGYASSSPPVAHFGLGGSAGPVSVEVMWPNGARQSVAVPSVDTVITVTQPR